MSSKDLIVIYHNPVCSSSRGALEILRSRGLEHEVIEYLQEPLSQKDFENLLGMLSGEPGELVRRDKRFKELGLDPAALSTAAAVTATLLQHPELMQRPVIVRHGRAVIARPPEKIDEVL